MTSSRSPATGASYTPRVGHPPPPDIPSPSRMFTLPDARTILNAAGYAVVICIANIALGFGINYAITAYRKPRGRQDGEDETSPIHVIDNSEADSRAVASQARIDAESATGSANVNVPDISVSKIRLSQMFIYPIKACAGVAVESARVTERGLENDRLFMVVDQTGRSVNQKKQPRLTLVRPSFDEQGRLYLEAPGMEPFVHEVKKWGTKQTVTHMTATCDGIDQGDEIADFFASFLGIPDLRLVRMREGFVRKVENKYVKPGLFQTSFSDAYPFLLVSEASLGELSDKTGKELEVSRFRPNIVVSGEGLKPFLEDSWKKLAIGEKATFEIPKSCIRCKVVTVDPSTGVLDEKNQPTEALKTFRSFRKAVVFGQNMVPTHRHRVVHLKIGDEVTITERQEAPVPDCAESENKEVTLGESSGA